MLPQPDRLPQVKFQIAIRDGPVISFTHISQHQDAGRQCGDGSRGPQVNVARSRDRESHCIPYTVRWRPTATAGIAKIAECFQNVLPRQFAFVAGSCAVPTPSSAQWKPCWMRPGAVFQPRHGHKVRTGQFSPFESRNLLGLAIVISSTISCERSSKAGNSSSAAALTRRL